jgi:hypothetical protein
MTEEEISPGNQRRHSFEVTSKFTAFRDQEEDYAPDPHMISANNLVFADLDAWRGKLRDGVEIVKFAFGTTWFYAPRSTFIKSTCKTTVPEFNKKYGFKSI